MLLLDAFHSLTNGFMGLTFVCRRDVRMWVIGQLHKPSERGKRSDPDVLGGTEGKIKQ